MAGLVVGAFDEIGGGDGVEWALPADGIADMHLLDGADGIVDEGSVWAGIGSAVAVEG